MSDNKGFGSYDPSKAGSRFKKRKINGIKEDVSNVYRVLPPYGKLADKNRISFYWKLHYGFVKSKNGKSIPIACIEESKTENKVKTITKRCPLCDRVAAMQNALEALKNRADGQAAALALSKQLEGMLNYGKPTANHHYLNVLTQTGTVELLKIGHKQMKALEGTLNEIQGNLKIIATAPATGLYLDFRRSGKGGDATQKVVPYTITDRDPSTGNLVPRYVESRLTPQDLERILGEVEDLPSMYRLFTPEELILIGQGDEETIKRLFSAPTEAEEEEPDNQQETVNGLVADAMTNYNMAQNAPTPAPQPVAAPAPAPVPAGNPAAQGFYQPPPVTSAPWTSAPAPTVAVPAPTPAPMAAAPAVAPTPAAAAPVAPTTLSPIVVPQGTLSVDQIIAQFSRGGQPG